MDTRPRTPWVAAAALALMVGLASVATAAPDARDHAYVRRRLLELVVRDWKLEPTSPGTFHQRWEATVDRTRFLEAYLGVESVLYADLVWVRGLFDADPPGASRALDELVFAAAGSGALLGGERVTEATFLEVWQDLKGLVLSLDPGARRGAGVTYGALVRLRALRSRDSQAAMRALEAARGLVLEGR